MGIFNKIMLATAVGGVCFSGMAAEKAEKAPVKPAKIALLLVDVGTIDSVAKTEEFLSTIKKVSNAEMPGLTAADRAAAHPALEREIVRVNWNTRKLEYMHEKAQIESENRRMANVLYQLRNSILSERNKRNVVLGKNYLQSYFQKYAKFIQVIDRANTSIAEVEKAIGGTDQVDVAGSTVFLTVIIGDMEENKTTVQVGNTMVTRHNYSLKMVANVRDFNGNVLFATDVVAKCTRRGTNVTATSGFNFADDLMEDGWKQIADKVGAFFITELDFKVKGPKGDENFDADDVVIYVDGKEIDGTKCKVLAYNHEVKAECEGYKTIERTVVIDEPAAKKTVKLNFKKAADKKEK